MKEEKVIVIGYGRSNGKNVILNHLKELQEAEFIKYQSNLKDAAEKALELANKLAEENTFTLKFPEKLKEKQNWKKKKFYD